MSTKDLYDFSYFKASTYYQKDPERILPIARMILAMKPKRVLDVGCGWGTLVEVLRLFRCKATGVDFSPDLPRVWKHREYFKVADAKNLPFAAKKIKFDIVISMDFWEHIPEEDIDQVLSEMKRVGKHVIAIIDYERKLTRSQQEYHVTNKPRLWWKKRLKGVKVL